MRAPFDIAGTSLRCEEVDLREIQQRWGTPCYIYSQAVLDARIKAYQDAFASYPTTICYAVKANGNLSLLQRIFAVGLGADIVSGGELRRVQLAGVDTRRVVYAGVGKGREELRAALSAGVMAINVESLFELRNLQQVAAELGRTAPVFLRLNFDIGGGGHAKIQTGLHSSKFGLPVDQLDDALKEIKKLSHLELIGLSCHVGSQILSLDPIRRTVEQLVKLAQEVMDRGYPLRYLDAGGGLGIRYRDEVPPDVTAYAAMIIQLVRPTGLHLVIEPGRSLVAEAGGLLTQVVGIKRHRHRNFVVVDASMTDLIRPTLYDAYHPLTVAGSSKTVAAFQADLVGPVCETGDILAEGRSFPEGVQEGDLVVLGCAGAYGMAMTSQYNSRPRPPEILIYGDQVRLIRQRESLEELWRDERPYLLSVSEDKV